MPLTVRQFPCLDDNYGFLAHDEASGLVATIDAHLATRPYLFGARPAYGDFGLWGQLYELWTDPTSGALIEGNAPHVLAWVHRMLWPRNDGPFEPWSTLAPTMMPILKQVGGKFMPWTLANEKCLAEGGQEFSVTLDGERWTQKPQKYSPGPSKHATSNRPLTGEFALMETR